MRVLIVDDNSGTREMMRIIVEKLGHHVAGEAEDGDAALQAFLNLRPDVVLLDIIMPAKSGLLVLTEILEADPAAKVIMVTAVDQDEVNAKIAANGAAGTIFKPFSKEDFEKAFKAVENR